MERFLPVDATASPIVDCAPKTLSPPKSHVVPKASLLGLPDELHLLISRQLTYPDALSLKHTSRHLFYLVDTGVELKVAWLDERHRLSLQLPNDRQCDLRSDDKFCRGTVKLLMRRRRAHLECESRPGLGCLVLGTTACGYYRGLRKRCKRWVLWHHQALEFWGILLFSLFPILIGYYWLSASRIIDDYKEQRSMPHI
ncbi:hypothetical protein GGS20DRAFT_532654 [Poronia punctata]|nr:hypothetical protein GGS20DRAFT_532654 [Poronia punctata]